MNNQQPPYNQQPQYGPQPQYGYNQPNQPQYNPYGPPQPVKPNNYMGLAIFCTICCCLITGIIAIMKANNVNSFYAMRQYDAANLASSEAKNWCSWSIVIGLVINVGYLIIVGGMGAAPFFFL